MTELFQRKTGHVTRAQADFFREWEHLLNQEERELVRYRKEIWTMSPEDRQSVGRCALPAHALRLYLTELCQVSE